ncbi:MAG: hypothetical protein COA42_24105 [Alteromonadaceae bacterium]|nr:MAG: hypothetical protein COA42_24105 [Alteromonadaceae bacterium]
MINACLTEKEKTFKYLIFKYQNLGYLPGFYLCFNKKALHFFKLQIIFNFHILETILAPIK